MCHLPCLFFKGTNCFLVTLFFYMQFCLKCAIWRAPQLTRSEELPCPAHVFISLTAAAAGAGSSVLPEQLLRAAGWETGTLWVHGGLPKPFQIIRKTDNLVLMWHLIERWRAKEGGRREIWSKKIGRACLSRKQRKERRIQKACLKACISIHYGAYALLSLLLQMALVFNHNVCVCVRVWETQNSKCIPGTRWYVFVSVEVWYPIRSVHQGFYCVFFQVLLQWRWRTAPHASAFSTLLKMVFSIIDSVKVKQTMSSVVSITGFKRCGLLWAQRVVSGWLWLSRF